MLPEDRSRSLLGPGLCLALLLAILSVWLRGDRTGPGHVAGPERFLSPSIRDAEFLPPSCANMSSLPYKPHAKKIGNWSPHGSPGFVLVSAHRLTAASFAVLGLSPIATQKSWGTYREICLWVSFSGPTVIEGSLSFHFAEETLDPKRELAITVIHCNLTRPTPKGAGGSLFVNVQEVDEVLVYREDPGPTPIRPPSPLPSFLTMCSTLLRPEEVSASASDHVLKNLQYMRFMGADGFALYDAGGLTAELAATLVPFVGAGLVEFFDMQGVTKYAVLSDALAANDCAFRMRFRATWVIILGLDEYPSLQDPSWQLPHLLQRNAGVPWLSLGTLIWDIEMCYNVHIEDWWTLEKMLFRSHSPWCTDKGGDPSLCLGSAGMRRLILDPRRVGLLLGNKVVLPLEGGVDLSTETAVINKYQALLHPAALECEYPVPENHPSKQWTRDVRMRDLIQGARKTNKIVLPR